MSDCGTGSTNTRMGDAAPAVPDGSLTARSTCPGSKADAMSLPRELLVAAHGRRAGPKKAAVKSLNKEYSRLRKYTRYMYNDDPLSTSAATRTSAATATSSLWARGQLLHTGVLVICHHSVC